MRNPEKDLAARTKSFARRIIRLYVALPKETVAQVPGNQALRSGTSVGANHREAGRARSKAEFISKIGDSLKEADETAYCIGRSCWQMKKLCQENGWSRYRRKPMS